MHRLMLFLALCAAAVSSKDTGDYMKPVTRSNRLQDASATTAKPLLLAAGYGSRTLGPIVIGPGPKIAGTRPPPLARAPVTMLARDPFRTIGPIVIMPGTARPKPALDAARATLLPVHRIGEGAAPKTGRPVVPAVDKVEATTTRIARDPSKTIGPIVIMPGTVRPKPVPNPHRPVIDTGKYVNPINPAGKNIEATTALNDRSKTFRPILIA